MSRRKQWRPVLEAEVKRRGEKSCAQIVRELTDEQCYEVEFEGRKYQVEVHTLENTDQHVHVIVEVDDGSIPASLRPLSTSFILKKTD